MMEPDALARRRRKPPGPTRPAAAGPLAAALRVARQAVLRDGIPGRGVRRVLPVARPDSGVAVEGAEPHAPHLSVVRMPAPEVRAAGGAEDLREAVVRLVGAQQLLAGEEAQRAGRDPRLRRRRAPGPPPAAR